MKTLSNTLLALLVSLSFGGVAQAGRPTKFLKKEVTHVRELLVEKAKAGPAQAVEMDVKLKAVINPVMEFDKLSEKALRKHWPTLDETQRGTFIKLFQDLVFESYLRRIDSANDDYTIVYEDETPEGRKAALVTAIAKTRKVEIELVFHLELREKGRWVAGDVVIDEVSLVENYREQFTKIIRKDGFEALIKKMSDKLADIRKDDKVATPAPAATTTPDAVPAATTPAAPKAP